MINTDRSKDDVISDLTLKVESLTRKVEEYRNAYDRLKHQFSDLVRNRFGSKSERFKEDASGQLDLFLKMNVPQTTTSKDENSNDNITVSAHKRKKKNTKDLSKLPRVIEIIPVSENDRLCACGQEKTVIRYETKELYDYQPAVFRIIERRREVVACQKGCGAAMITAPLPASILPKIKATESLLAHIIVSKLHDRQPLYHLEKYGRAVDVSRETMARWMIALHVPLQPLLNLLKDKIIDHDISSLDATMLQVLKEPERPATTKSYAYCFRGGPKGQSVVLYAYNHEKHKQFVDQWFEGFSGYVHMDADPFFELLLDDATVLAVFCHAHSRRKFEAVKHQAKKQGLAHEALRFYKKLYAIERQAKDNALSAKQRYAYRLKHSGPIIQAFKTWLDHHLPSTLPTSPLGKAFRYLVKRWGGFTRFLDDGRLEIDNNLTEQEIKPFVLARKNFMFANSMEGAHALCAHLSLIRTALIHKIDPFQYYVTIMKKLPLCKTIEDYEALLPWNIVIG